MSIYNYNLYLKQIDDINSKQSKLLQIKSWNDQKQGNLQIIKIKFII